MHMGHHDFRQNQGGRLTVKFLDQNVVQVEGTQATTEAEDDSNAIDDYGTVRDTGRFVVEEAPLVPF